MATTTGFSSRRSRDANLSTNIALPIAANTVTTTGLDLGEAAPYPISESISARITIDTATGANSKNVNAVFQDSADNSSFTNIASLAAPLLVASGNAANVIGKNIVFQMPLEIRRYVRASATGEANGGNAADGKLTLALLF
jgi:hypothetical protein